MSSGAGTATKRTDLTAGTLGFHPLLFLGAPADAGLVGGSG